MISTAEHDFYKLTTILQYMVKHTAIYGKVLRSSSLLYQRRARIDVGDGKLHRSDTGWGLLCEHLGQGYCFASRQQRQRYHQKSHKTRCAHIRAV